MLPLSAPHAGDARDAPDSHGRESPVPLALLAAMGQATVCVMRAMPLAGVQISTLLLAISIITLTCLPASHAGHSRLMSHIVDFFRSVAAYKVWSTISVLAH
jgi:hypothetical protein